MSSTFDPTKPVQTRDGRKARIVCTDIKGHGAGDTIVALVTDRDGGECAFTYQSGGRYMTGTEHSHDLVNVPERTERFFAVYHTGQMVTGATRGWLEERDLAELRLAVAYEDGKPVSVELVAA